MGDPAPALAGLARGVARGAFGDPVPLLVNPAVFQQYWQAVTMHRPTAIATLTLGHTLRLVFGEQREWLQFVPLVPGTAWFLAYWARHRKTWEWAEQAPLLLLVSFLTTFYAWSYDYVLLLVPIIQVACLMSRDFRLFPSMAAIGVYLSFSVLYCVINLAGCGDQVYFLWMLPAFLLAYLGLRRLQERYASVETQLGVAS